MSSTCGPTGGGVTGARGCDHRAFRGRLRRRALRTTRRHARFLHDLRERFAKFGLELHPGKTRLIEFGRFAAANRQKRGAGKPETFDFLGFTHICAKMRDGRFWVRRITVSKRVRAKLAEVKDQLRRRQHLPVPEQGRWLASVVRGHCAYYAVPGNRKAVRGVPYPGDAALARGATAPQPALPPGLESAWTAWRLGGCRLPAWCIRSLRCGFAPRPKAGAQCVSSARWDLRGGPPARAVPTAI